MSLRNTYKINEKGHLEFGGADCVALAQKFHTPLYVMDEKHIREMMRVYRDAIEEEYDANGLVLYASKAFSCKAIYAIAKQEKIGVDVVSGGELYTAIQINFPAEHIYLHGNNKTYEELLAAVEYKIGAVVLDSFDEACILNDIAKEHGVIQNVLIRINPGVEAHTHAYVQTALPDSKFGFSVANGSAKKMAKHVLSLPNLCLKGFHCHIGSQIFEIQSFLLAAKKCLAFVEDMKNELNFTTKTLNLGGGFGVWYAEGDKEFSIEDYRQFLKAIINVVKEECAARSLELPFLVVEPGRSIVAEAGITLYTVGAIKEIEGIRKYVAIDGGMFDNPRYALYQSKYTACLANRANEQNTETVSIAGKCCESGDLIGVDFALPKAQRGDILAVFTTGAYNYSMASNYNRNMIPPVVLVNDGVGEYIIKPQTMEDLVRNDVVPERLVNK